MFVQPFEFPILNKRVIVLEKNITHKSRNFSQKQGMNIRLNIFGDYNNKFGVLTRNMSVVTKEEDDDDNNNTKKRMFNPGFHNKILCNLFKKDRKEEKEVLFSRINLRKHNSINTVVLNSDINKHKTSENNINIHHHHHQHKHKKKKAVSIITDRKPEEILIRNLYLNNNERKKDIKTLLTVKKIPKEIFRNTLQMSPKVQFNNQNKHILRYFNSHSINNNTLLSTNEYFKRK